MPMEEQAANLLLHAKRHFFGDGKRSPIGCTHFACLDTIVTLFPRTDAATEAATILHNSELSSTNDSMVT